MRSFDPDPSVTTTDERGQRVHARSLDQSTRLQRCLYTVRPGAWCLVGNGLSNQTFIEGPQGVIAIDTGESVEEMSSALQELRRMTQTPMAAVIYTHSRVRPQYLRRQAKRCRSTVMNEFRSISSEREPKLLRPMPTVSSTSSESVFQMTGQTDK
jgi:hypothetical protein